MAPDVRAVGTVLLTAVSEEVAVFCEDRKGCFDLDLTDLIDGKALLADMSGSDEERSDGSVSSEVTRPLNYLFSMSSNILLNARDNFESLTSRDGDRGRDILRKSSADEEDNIEIKDEDAEHFLCLHDDDINTSDNTLNALTAVGVVMKEALRISGDSAINGSATFLPCFSNAYLPSSFMCKSSHTIFILSEKMKKKLSKEVKILLILTNVSNILRDAGLKISIVSRIMIAREIRMKNILSWLIDFSQINDGMVSISGGHVGFYFSCLCASLIFCYKIYSFCCDLIYCFFCDLIYSICCDLIYYFCCD